MVFVPESGDFLVRNGQAIPVVEVSLHDLDSEYMNWTVWTENTEEWDEDEDS